MARNNGAISRLFDLFFNAGGPVTITTQQLNELAQGDGTRRYRDLIAEGSVRETNRRVLPNRQVEYTAVHSSYVV